MGIFEDDSANPLQSEDESMNQSLIVHPLFAA